MADKISDTDREQEALNVLKRISEIKSGEATRESIALNFQLDAAREILGHIRHKKFSRSFGPNQGSYINR